MNLNELALGTSKNCSSVRQLGRNLSHSPGQGLHKPTALHGQAEEMLWEHGLFNTTYMLHQMLYSLLSGWVSCGNWTHWEIMQVTNAGDKSAEVSALEEGCGISKEQHLLVRSC